MAIDKININNFTVFKEIDIEFSKGINVFIGENGTGKTHLLKAIYSPNTTIRQYYRENSVYGEVEQDEISSDISNITSDIFGVSNNYMKTQFPNIEFNGTSEGYMFPTTLVFIPAKEMLSLSKILKINDKYKKALNMDKTLIDIIEKALNLKPDNIPEIANTIVPILEKHIDGKIFVEEDDTFWVLKNNGDKVPFTMEAEGIRKLGLLWQLLMNENITNGTVLLWDEPESNLNPKLIPDLVEILLELSRNGVQIFLATHDYFLPNFIDVLKKEDDNVLFHALYKTEHGVQCESEKSFDMLENNSINKELITLYKEGVKKVMQ